MPGLTWMQLYELTAAALSQGGCLGASVVIYNPDLDKGSTLPGPRIQLLPHLDSDISRYERLG